MRTDAGVKAHAVDDLTGVKPSQLAVGVKLVEVADTHRKVGVCKELYRLRLRGVGEQHGDVRIKRTLGQERSKQLSVLLRRHAALRSADHDAAGVQIVVKRLALTQKFG